MELMGSDEICIQILGAPMNYLFFSASRLLACVYANLLCISKHSGLLCKLRDTVDENDAQNVFVFQSTGLLKVISERPGFLHISCFRPPTSCDDLFAVSGLAFRAKTAVPPSRVVDATCIGSVTLSPLSA